MNRLLDDVLSHVPLAAYRPLRECVLRLPRWNPVRVVATKLLRRAAQAHRGTLMQRLGAAGELRPLDAPGLSFEPADSMVMDAVYWFGIRGYEGIVAQVWTQLCRNARAVLEIGGNVGLFAVIGGKATTGRYTVVEPVPAIAATLRANLRRNGLTGRVTLVEGAAIPGDAEKPVLLNLPNEGRAMPVGAHLLEQVEVSGRQTLTELTVRGIPVRTLAAECDLIKIDAEGVEAVLLADLWPLLQTARPTMLIEVLPEATQLGGMIVKLARDLGYGIYVLPEFGSDRVVTVPADSFTAETPRRHRSKDIVLSMQPIA